MKTRGQLVSGIIPSMPVSVCLLGKINLFAEENCLWCDSLNQRGLTGYLVLALMLHPPPPLLNSLRWEHWAALWATDVSQTNHCRESWLDSRIAAKNLRTKEGLWRRQNRRELTGLLYSPHSHFHTPKSLITHVRRSDRVKRIVHVSATAAIKHKLLECTFSTSW